MNDNTTNRNYERAANPEASMLQARLGQDQLGISNGLKAIEAVLPELTVGPAPAVTETNSSGRADVAYLADRRHLTELDHIRAAVEDAYGRAA